MSEIEPQSFRLAAGQDVILEFRRATPPAGGVAGWGMRFRLFTPAGVVEKTTAGGGVTTTDATAGYWDVTLSDADTDGLPVALLPWDFWRSDDGSESPEAYGTADVYDTRRG